MKKLFDALGDSLREEEIDPNQHVQLEKKRRFDFIRSYAESSFRPLEMRPDDFEYHLMEQGETGLAQHLLWTFGPKHHDLPFLLQLRCQIEGDLLLSASPEIGWLHQGIEKKLETCSFSQSLDLLADLHPENPITHQILYICTYEKHLGLHLYLGEHSKLFRSILLELSRIFEHLSNLYTLAMAHLDLHSQTLLKHAKVQIRNKLFALSEIKKISEQEKINLRYYTLGEFSYESKVDILRTLQKELPELHPKLSIIFDFLSHSPSFQQNMSGLGTITSQQALEYGLTGPALRASGIQDDLRKHSPYLAYDDIKISIQTQDQGDALARFFQRVTEINHSSTFIIRAIKKLEVAYLKKSSQTILKKSLDSLATDQNGDLLLHIGHSSMSIEAPSGELHMMLSGNSTSRPNRLRIKGASFTLCAALSKLSRNTELDRVVSLILSLGILPGELDR